MILHYSHSSCGSTPKSLNRFHMTMNCPAEDAKEKSSETLTQEREEGLAPGSEIRER